MLCLSVCCLFSWHVDNNMHLGFSQGMPAGVDGILGQVGGRVL